MDNEPVFVLRASEPNAAALMRCMVDRRRSELLRKERTPEVVEELRHVARLDELADEMADWRHLSGKKC